ncbi:hypothetical protein ACET3Z_026354 [Daucus carota]
MAVAGVEEHVARAKGLLRDGEEFVGYAIVAKVYVSLEPPCWTVDADKLMKSFTSKTKAVVLNSFTVLTTRLEKFSLRMS